jgi:dipeptidyl aminopeptidase/acylaminoacyl peptidase
VPETDFTDLQSYVELPRLAALALSPDGTRLVTSAAALTADRTAWRTALWEVDPTGEVPARRLTRGAKGESQPVFTPAGDLLFVTARPDPDTKDDPETGAVWCLPAAGGEAALLGRRAGGISALAVAREAGTVLATSPTLPAAVTGADDTERRKARADAKVSAILHSGYPVRFWDSDLGPDEPRLLVRDGDDWRDLTPTPGSALRDTYAAPAPDGRTVVTSWWLRLPQGVNRSILVALDTETGERRTLLADPDHDYGHAEVSPDGAVVAVLRTSRSTPKLAPRSDLVIVPLTGGEARPVAPEWDRSPASIAWTPDSTALVVSADEQGRGPLFRIDLESDAVTRLTGDHGAYSDAVVSPDGGTVYALRSAVDCPPHPVRLDARTPDQQPTPLPGPVEPPVLPGTLTEVTAAAEDGSPLRAWLVLPESDAPAPLLLWVHGGPLGSWNTWQWRWNPWLMAARGYAVLLPDPALSTGYGQAFVQRGWGAWGGPPYTDLLRLTDAAEALPEVDETRTAAMGGSFGGYMANWIAGHTDRFRAIVTHASLWALDQFGPTTDLADYWLTEMTPEMAAANSPHLHADAIRTPMLVIHGDKDYRVPIGEALRLWWDLVSRVGGAENPHRFLYFPSENHWVLTPQHAALWYETVHAFLAHHLRGEPLEVPELLR